MFKFNHPQSSQRQVSQKAGFKNVTTVFFVNNANQGLKINIDN